MSPEAANSVRPALSPGDKVSYFQVIEPIAAGGMALVWKGYDGLLGRNVAIKQIAAGEAADETAREAFRREGEIQKQVSASHKNLVSVLEFVEDERGLFLVMEYVDGASLDQTLSQLEGPMPPKQALGIIHQVAVGLAAIHQAGVIHRDLKPSNILLPKEGGVKICDFGIATPAEDQDLLNLGTARYMAPEMFTEDQIDARADLYGLGMISYEMLAGRPAFENAFKVVLRDKRNQSLRWMKWHTNQRVAAPSLAKLNPDLPQPLVELVERLMAKDRDQRIGSATQLIDVLKRNFSGQRPAQQATGAAAGAATAETAPAASTSATAPLPKRSKLTLVLAAMLAFWILAIGGYFGYQKWQEAQTQEDIRAAALAKYVRAKEAYEAGQREDLITAGELFKELNEQWPNDPVLGTASGARFQLVAGIFKKREGLQLTEEMKFQEAMDRYEEALTHFSRAESLALSLDDPRISALLEDIQNYESQARSEMAVPEKGIAIEKLIAEGEFNEASRQRREFMEGKTLLAHEQAVLERLGRQIKQREANAEIEGLLAEAERLREERAYERALGVVRQAKDASRKQEGTALDPQLAELETQLERQIDYERAMSAARKAEDEGDLDQAIRHYTRANRLSPDENLDTKLTDLRSELAYRRGREAERNGNLDQARRLYIESNTIKQNKPAEQGLARIGKAEDYQSLVQLGNQKFSGEDYPTAIDAWRKAAGLATEEGERQTLQAKIREAQVRWHVQLARQAMNRGEYDQASAEIDKALSADASDAVAKQLREDLDLIQTYNALVAQGDQARRDGRFDVAKRRYRDALEVIEGTSIDREEVEKRLDDAEYESLIASARSMMEVHQWKTAKAMLETAKRLRDTETVDELIGEVDKHLPSG